MSLVTAGAGTRPDAGYGNGAGYLAMEKSAQKSFFKTYSKKTLTEII